MALIGRLALHYPSHRDLPASAWAAVLEDYASDLSGEPIELLQRAIGRVRRESKWFPTIAEILAACKAERLPEPMPVRRLSHLSLVDYARTRADELAGWQAYNSAVWRAAHEHAQLEWQADKKMEWKPDAKHQ